MKTVNKKIKKRATKKDCPYCGYFKPCGNCEALAKREPEIVIGHSLR